MFRSRSGLGNELAVDDLADQMIGQFKQILVSGYAMQSLDHGLLR
ncbi:MAG: hypothetical protein ACRESZ_12740 [Methylococcales bacterium]